MRIFTLTLLCLLYIHPAQSQTIELSTAEDFALAFYKTGKALPNFEKWVKATDPYQKTPLAHRPKVLEEHIEVKKNAYTLFNPEKDILTIRTQAKVSVSSLINENGENLGYLNIDFRYGVPEFFPITFLDMNIAVIAEKIESFTSVSLLPIQYQSLQETYKRARTANIILELKPKKADISQPYVRENDEFWLFLTEIASISAWNQDGFLIWEYTAPWFISQETEILRGLQQKKTVSE